LLLFLEPRLVQMEKAVKEIPPKTSEFIWGDIMAGAWRSPAQTMNFTSRGTKTGIMGDPTVATAEKGKKLAGGSRREPGQIHTRMEGETHPTQNRPPLNLDFDIRSYHPSASGHHCRVFQKWTNP